MNRKRSEERDPKARSRKAGGATPSGLSQNGMPAASVNKDSNRSFDRKQLLHTFIQQIAQPFGRCRADRFDRTFKQADISMAQARPFGQFPLRKSFDNARSRENISFCVYSHKPWRKNPCLPAWENASPFPKIVSDCSGGRIGLFLFCSHYIPSHLLMQLFLFTLVIIAATAFLATSSFGRLKSQMQTDIIKTLTNVYFLPAIFPSRLETVIWRRHVLL